MFFMTCPYTQAIEPKPDARASSEGHGSESGHTDVVEVFADHSFGVFGPQHGGSGGSDPRVFCPATRTDSASGRVSY